MLPLLNIYRSGNLTKEGIEENFGTLVLATKLKPYLFFGSFLLAAFFLTLFVAVSMKYCKERKNNKIKVKPEFESHLLKESNDAQNFL